MEITAGAYHTCVRKFNGNVYCWGSLAGQRTAQPTLIWQGATQIDAGYDHTCGLDAGGAAYCWGGDSWGQLGRGNLRDPFYHNPGPVVGPLDSTFTRLPALKFTAISAGYNSTCGTGSSGVYCWGYEKVIAAVNTFRTTPTLVSPYPGFTALAVGGNFACGLSFRDIRCWGENGHGQTGFDPALAVSFFYPGTSRVMFGLGHPVGDFVRVSAALYSTCGDRVIGTVECFGENDEGQLGNGQSGASMSTHIPQPVGGGQPLHGVSAGYKHACALDPNGAAWCWGQGDLGQLGNGVAGPRATAPVPVTGNLTFRAIAAGSKHTCAIGTDNHIYCWGENTYFQLGATLLVLGREEMTTIYSARPVRAADPTS